MPYLLATSLNIWYVLFGTPCRTRTHTSQLSVAMGYKPTALPIELKAHWSNEMDSNHRITRLQLAPLGRLGIVAFGGQRRTRTSELRRELIYSQWPLPLGYLPIMVISKGLEPLIYA